MDYYSAITRTNLNEWIVHKQLRSNGQKKNKEKQHWNGTQENEREKLSK